VFQNKTLECGVVVADIPELVFGLEFCVVVAVVFGFLHAADNKFNRCACEPRLNVCMCACAFADVRVCACGSFNKLLLLRSSSY